MDKYDDFVKACVDLMLTVKFMMTLTKTKDSLFVYVYSKNTELLSSPVFYKTDSLEALRAKFAGLKSVCEFLMSDDVKDDGQAT